LRHIYFDELQTIEISIRFPRNIKNIGLSLVSPSGFPPRHATLFGLAPAAAQTTMLAGVEDKIGEGHGSTTLVPPTVSFLEPAIKNFLGKPPRQTIS